MTRRLLVLAVAGLGALAVAAPGQAQIIGGDDYCSGTIRQLSISISGPGTVAPRMYDTAASCVLDVSTCSASCSTRVQHVCEFHCRHKHNGPLPWNVELVANESPGAFFRGWSSNCVPLTSQPRRNCAVRMGVNQSVGASFASTPDTSPPSQPSFAPARAGAYEVALSWTPSSDDNWLGGYDLFKNGSVLEARLAPGTTSYRVDNLFCETTYAFRLEAFDANSAAASETISVTTGRCGGTSIAPAPNTVLHVKPRRVTKSRQAYFHWGASQARVTYQCRLDRARRWSACRPGKTYRRLRKGTHTFRVRARNNAGKVDPTPAVWRWRIR